MKLKDILREAIINAQLNFRRYFVRFIPSEKGRLDAHFKINIEKMAKLNPIKRINCKVGRYSYCAKSLDVQHSETTIGSFCSIAQNVIIGPGEHPIECLSTSPCLYTSVFGWKGRTSKFKIKANPCHIGNDVWIGHGVFIKQGITVGDGAVIAAGAVVVKDVPPYAVVGGVPAKVIKYRFDKNIIDDLLELKWWDLDDEIIKKIPFDDIEEAIKFLKEVRKKQNTISIAIPTLQKRPDVLEKLVITLSKNSSVGEIIIIDNSTKGIPFKNDKMRVITPKENIFVNPAWNLGVREAKYDIVGLLNDDIIISDKICDKILNLFKESKNLGALAFHLDFIEPVEDMKEAPKDTEVKTEKADYVAGGYGMALFFRKKLYKPIPEKMKIWFGDNFIFNQIKKEGYDNCWIKGQKVYHLGSLTSGAFKKSPLYKQDKKAWSKVKYKWYHYIFSLEEYSDCKKMRLLGMNIRLYTKK